MTQTKQQTSTKTSEAKKIKELEKTIADLNAMVQVLMKQGALNSNSVGERDVLFISLCNHILNLSTDPNGGGTIYTFTEFGEEQSIPYSDARKLIRNNRKFIKGGKCYIADDDIIEAEHLTSDYKKILDKDALLDLLGADRTKFKKLFDNLTDTQKDIFKDIVVDRLIKNRNSVDMNIVQYVNDTMKTNLMDIVDYNKELFAEEN